MGFQYVIAREAVTPVANETLLAMHTNAAAASINSRINEIFVGGEATAAVVNRYVLRRVSTLGITPTAQVPAELSSSSPAAQVTAATTFATEPVTVAAPAVWTAAMNAFGGVIRWVAAPGQEILNTSAVLADLQVSFENAAGISIISCQIVFEEV